jgi:hypothetical protein
MILTPWLNICIITPCQPLAVSAKSVAAIKPMWAMEE